jgi:membrane associated rhomboid family serine protease
MPPLDLIPLACGTHIAVDAAIFGAPVGMLLLTIFALNRWGPQDE